jgi:hypothetical protein
VVPREQDLIRRAVVAFPDAASVAYLRQVGVRTVLVVRSLTGDAPYNQFATAPLDGLGLTREVRPDAVVFTLS